jgi:hypothetical protein
LSWAQFGKHHQRAKTISQLFKFERSAWSIRSTFGRQRLKEPAMKVALAIVLTLLLMGWIDQALNYGRLTSSVFAMLRDIEHGFGY